MTSVYHNNPNTVLDISVDPDDTDFLNDVWRAVTVIVEGWAAVTRDELVISQITGGNTNALFKVEATSVSDIVVLRIFGRDTELFIDRYSENAALSQLSEKGLAPTFHGLIKNGRIEGFIQGRDLQPHELPIPKVMSAVTEKMATLHFQPISLPETPSIWSKTRKLLETMQGFTASYPSIVCMYL